jgi:hypothetical protein
MLTLYILADSRVVVSVFLLYLTQRCELYH